jgi:hypothetical protein
LNIDGNPSAESTIRFIDSKDVLLTAPRLLTPATVFLQVEGSGNDRITVDGGDISKAQKPLALLSGADEKAVRLRT